MTFEPPLRLASKVPFILIVALLTPIFGVFPDLDTSRWGNIFLLAVIETLNISDGRSAPASIECA